MALIKSHSNYVLRKRHQEVSDGTIWERDITTIGGVNQFAPGQIPIYKSSNFIITVRNDGKIANQYNKTKWKENESGDTWTLETISGMTSEFEDQNDVKIVLKQDYYDFRDFAYYGSLTEMFRASINDILSRFPGELYVAYDSEGETKVPLTVYYTSCITDDFEKAEERIALGNSGDTLVSNPFSVNIHSIKRPLDGKPLKYFAEDGFKNYQIIDGDSETSTEISNWITRNFIKVVKKEEELDKIFGNDAFYYDWLKPQILSKYFNSANTNEIWWMENNNNEITEKSKYKNTTYSTPSDKGSEGYDILVDSFQSSSGEIRTKFTEYDNGYWVEKNGVKCDPSPGNVYSSSATAYQMRDQLASSDTANTYTVGHGAMCGEIGCYVTTPCKGYQIASVTANSIVIGAWVGDNNEIIYLTDKTNIDKHIRPLEKFVIEFYNECDNFEKILLNRKTTPKYKSIFSVIKDDEKGYYREMEEFVFPTSYGNYNIDASSYGFSDYTVRLAEIGAYYDEFFTDNLYRSMTHEAIKNFDWTYTREFYYGDDEEYRHGGEKIQKALRIFAREFDEILAYINNIKNVNRVTYDERNNVPDYFLIDEVENKGWDVCLVYPYDLEEYYYTVDPSTNVKTKNYIQGEYTEQQQLENKDGGNFFIRQFSQNTKKEVTPYSKKWVYDYPEGYFISCCGDDQPCQYEGSDYRFVDATNLGSTYFDPCEKGDEKIKNRIKSYTDEKTYTYIDANNEFMRRMAINSVYIWRHKGTVEGIEMILGMFGLKSKRWVDRLTKNCINDKVKFDYEVDEYSSFTNRIEERWDAVHQMYRVDWINSTKTIVYDYRTTSNYTKYGAQPNYVSYQGLPVSYRYEDVNSGKPAYIKVSPLLANENQEATSSKDAAFKKVETNEPVLRRYLYPNFDKNEQLDGNPYFQMRGGWLSKTVQASDAKIYNFQYDVDDNIAYTCYVPVGEETSTGVIDNNPIYKETVRNIKRVDTLGDLITVPVDTLTDGTIYYVSHIDEKVAIINNQVYRIKTEYNPNDPNNPYRYVSLVKNDNYIKIGDDRFFDQEIHVYNKDGVDTTYSLEDKEYGYEVKAYILDDDSFICYADEDKYYTIDSFVIFGANITSAATNYFIIDNTYYSDRISIDGDGTGWRILYPTDPEYIRINTIKNYYEGNNPHNGNMVYDSGHEYFTYYKRLFKHAIDNDLFDERCYESFYKDMDDEIVGIGFNKTWCGRETLIHENEMITQYFPYISGLTETKIHYFGTYYERDESAKMLKPTSAETVNFYGENQGKVNELKKLYKHLDNNIEVKSYILNGSEMIGGSPYSSQTGVIDEITNQVLNNKRLTIKFYLHKPWYTNQGQCELKYLDDIVMNYLTQMIPSTAIVEIKYISNGTSSETGNRRWVDTEECENGDKYLISREQILV
jgi:hypothetical protein